MFLFIFLKPFDDLTKLYNLFFILGKSVILTFLEPVFSTNNILLFFWTR